MYVFCSVPIETPRCPCAELVCIPVQKGGLSCPTCRQHAPASDITVVGPPKAEGSATGNGQGQLQDAEADIAVAGSYGTKVIGYSLHSIDCTQV